MILNGTIGEKSNGTNAHFLFGRPIKAKEIGHHLVVFTEDLIEDNRIREEDIEKYVSEYETPRWNQIYQDLHILTKKEKKDIKKREYSRFL